MIGSRRGLTRALALWLAVVVAVGAIGLTLSPQPRAAVAQASPVPSSRFLLGVNYPWLRYGGDFGSNPWGEPSVSTDTATVDAEFADMAAKGVRVVRWFVFADGRSILTDASGIPTGVNGNVFQDLDAALAIAGTHGIMLDLVLFDYLLLRKTTADVAGHADWINDEAKRIALVARVVRPVLAHVGNHPNLLMWEVMNEPEWTIADLPGAALSSEVEPTTLAAFWDFAWRVSSAVHALAEQVTVGSASLFWAHVWTNDYAANNGLRLLHLDVFQTHYYPSPNDDRYNPFIRPYADVAADFGLDQPLIVSEFTLTSGAQLDALLTNGYAGAWPWSYRGGEPISTVNWGEFTAWERAHGSDLGDRPPTPTPTASPTPTSGPGCTPTPVEATGTALRLASDAGICWSDVNGTGPSVLTHGHVGCSAIDADGFCMGGAWVDAGVAIEQGRWIWKTQQADQAEVEQSITFIQQFELPSDATSITGTIQITADNGYRVYLNGVVVGSDEAPEGWRTVETFELTALPGTNSLAVDANNGGPAAVSPTDNPAGLLYRLDVSFEVASTATATPTDTPTATSTATPSPTNTPTLSPTPTATATPIPTATPSPTRRPPTKTPIPTKTPVPTSTPIPQPPAAPSNLSASQSRTDVLLSWRDNATTELGYRVYRSADNGQTWTRIADGLPANTVAYTNRQVARSTRYQYAVAAYNGAGESKWSNKVKVSVP